MLIIPRPLFLQMQQQVAARAPEEACGLLAGEAGICALWIPVENSLHAPYAFRMEPRQLLAALETIDNAGQKLLAIYHSHPNGPAHPSQRDLQEAYYPDCAFLVWSPSNEGWTCQGYRLQVDHFAPLPLAVQP